MGAFNEVESVPRRIMTLFFMVDTSTSMKGDKIRSLNEAVRETVPFLSELSVNNADSEVKIAVLEFSSGTEWMHPQPVGAEVFQWKDLSADGITDFGEACTELCNKLSVKAFMNQSSGSFAPVIILLSDGEPTDNYKKGIEQLKNNNWFKAAIKIAIAIGEDANKNVLAEFAGNKECVLTVHNKEQLKKIIHFVSVTASQVASRNASTSASGIIETKKGEVIERIEQAKGSGDLQGIDVGSDTRPSDADVWGSW